MPSGPPQCVSVPLGNVLGWHSSMGLPACGKGASGSALGSGSTAAYLPLSHQHVPLLSSHKPAGRAGGVRAAGGRDLPRQQRARCLGPSPWAQAMGVPGRSAGPG
jgi:hypothetical protein